MSLALRLAQYCLKRISRASAYRSLLCLVRGVSSACFYFVARLVNLPFSGRLPLAQTPNYVYQPLATDRHIRTLEFCPSSNTNPEIYLKVDHVHIDSAATRYTAISFVFGDRDLNPAVSVGLDDGQVQIPPSLHSALRRVRTSGGMAQHFWVSAVSINQAETKIGLAEKSLQVRMMDEVFSKAEEVIIDLGESDEETDDLLSTLDKYQLVPEDVWYEIDIKASHSSIHHSTELCAAMNLPGPNSNFWHAFRRFMGRPWFTRVWIVQEFALARKARFMIGSQFREKQFLRYAITRAAKHLEILYLQDRFHAGTLVPNKILEDAIWVVLVKSHAVHSICLAAEQSGTGLSRSLCEVLDATTTYFQATKNCDIVYALLGLVTDAAIKSDLVVDYNEPLAKFMLRVSQYLVQHRDGKYVLYHSVGDRAGYTSWTINLQGPPDGLPHLVDHLGRLRYGDFTAGGPARFPSKMSSLRVDGLTVRACVIDTVQMAMAKALLPHQSELSTQQALMSHAMWQMLAFEWMLDVAPTQPLPLADLMKLCWRVVVADLIMPSDSGGRGYCRMRDWTDSARCLDTVDTVFQAACRKQRGKLPASFTMDLTPTQLTDLRIYADSLSHTIGRKLAMSGNLEVPCLVPLESSNGDRIVIVQGCQMPFVMRLNCDEKGDYYRLVGCAYVHGVMDGEMVQRKDWKFEDLEIC